MAQAPQEPFSIYTAFPKLADPGGVITFAIVCGAFSFAMMAATWLIRERRRLEKEQSALGLELADLKSRHERAQALLDVPDQRVIIWSNWDEQPVSRGTLPEMAGTPRDIASFIDFESWMNPASVTSFMQAVARLRERAEGFDLTVDSRDGGILEVQGRASGSHAFVRFIALSGDRAALASLEAQHTRMLQTTDLMRALLESVPMPVWLREDGETISWANRAYLQAVDAESLDTVCEHSIELLDAAQREEIASQRKQDKVHAFARFNGRMPATLSGDRRTVDVNEVTYGNGSAGMAVDMSEVEQIKSSLRRTTDGHAQTMNQLATAVAIFDEQRRLTFFNQAFQDLWKLDDRQLSGEPDNATLFDTLRAEGMLAEQPDWSKWRNGLLKVYSDTQPQEHWWHLPDNRTLRVIANPHEQGGVTWVFENITEKLEMESRYIALTQVQGETLDHLTEAIAVFASDGRLKLSNPSFQNLWNLADEEVAAGTLISQIAHHCIRSSANDGAWQRLVTAVTGVDDRRTAIEGRMMNALGNTLDYAMVPLPNGQNMISFVDVTASVNMETALTERNEALTAAERLKNAFIEHVSYEFRAPLTNIIGFTDMLAEEIHGPLNDKQKEYVGHVASSSSVLHSLVDNMLDLATVDAGIMQLELDTIDLRETLRGAVASVRDLLRETGVRLHMRAPPEPVSFVGDSTRIQQILFNLLNNAVRFSPEGSEIKLEASDDIESVTIRISDAGPGIPEDKRDAIFERFEAKAHSGASRGAGLGLAIARSLAELHGGTIQLDEGVTEGASFVCRFPKKPAELAAAAE
ncbi:ATP-binding protein [Pseudahrensia aquimaris]|uniref:histidine kinase n=1 Tax=Pseudahrensia aquimaris TaxID=744461 RepID=A0ABW3FEH4_9HYPH